MLGGGNTRVRPQQGGNFGQSPKGSEALLLAGEAARDPNLKTQGGVDRTAAARRAAQTRALKQRATGGQADPSRERPQRGAGAMRVRSNQQGGGRPTASSSLNAWRPAILWYAML